jgi:dTDP-4-dehydrorhamnose 3,5-epimerase
MTKIRSMSIAESSGFGSPEGADAVNVIPTPLEGVMVIETQIFGDLRGFFLESYQKKRYSEAGITMDFVQDNLSFSQRDTLRGLHYQYPRGQGKLVQVLIGEVYDVAVDIRYGSPTFGQWFGVTLSAEIRRQLFVPQGFAHGFCVLSDTALFMYKCTDYYVPEDEGGICWDDPDLSIEWPVKAPILSDRDQGFSPLRGLTTDRLPVFQEGA